MALSTCVVTTDESGKEQVVHGTPLFPYACYNDNMETDPVPWHWHDHLEIIVVEQGTAVVSVEGETRLVRQGDGCFINAGALHSVWEGEDGLCILRSAVFLPRLVGGSMDSIFWQRYVGPLVANTGARFISFHKETAWEREAIQAIEGAWLASVEDAPGYEFQVRADLSRLIFLLCRHCPPEEKGLSDKALRDSERIKVMLQFIQENYGEELTTEKIARSAAISDSECLRCFRAMVDTTPIQYVKQLRVQKAAELLAGTDRKIADIGALCGFQEMSYFAKTFRALKGRTPSAYRAEKRAAGLRKL